MIFAPPGNELISAKAYSISRVQYLDKSWRSPCTSSAKFVFGAERDANSIFHSDKKKSEQMSGENADARNSADTGKAGDVACV